MKKFFLFSVMALVALATGCSKSDDEFSQKDLVGIWVEVSREQCPNNVTFNSDGTYEYRYYDFDGNKCIELEDEKDKGTYVVDGSKIKVKYENDQKTNEVTIEKLTQTELVCKDIKGDKRSFRRK